MDSFATGQLLDFIGDIGFFLLIFLLLHLFLLEQLSGSIRGTLCLLHGSLTVSHSDSQPRDEGGQTLQHPAKAHKPIKAYIFSLYRQYKNKKQIIYIMRYR
ncbi:hypothetical protein E2C01_005128 [Portunus trituberculatus]|uniref:Uncharacterized protein n=1 Tax=Portunus trituberculatus TaxID=210409 RepID=A0A5B7CUQ5_PORTR|nr:hypothetical protein [Portunus trituberculatus]